MPRRKPDEVKEHRIALGTWEREQIKEVKEAVEVALIGTGVGIASVGIGGTYVAYKIGKALYDWGDDIIDGFKDGLESLDESKALSKSSFGPTKIFWMALGLNIQSFSLS